MILVNRTKGVVVYEDIREAKTSAEKSRGLIGSDGSFGVNIKTRWGIHTFGMKFPIDAAVLNKRNTIIKIRKRIKPSRFFFWNPRHKMVVEMPSVLVNDNWGIGDELEWLSA